MDIQNLINKEQFFVGIPTEIGNICKVYPVTVREIATIGAKNFYSYLNLFTLDKEDIDEFLQQQGVEERLTPFQFTLVNANEDKQYLENLEKAFKFFLHEEQITVLIDNEAIILGDINEGRVLMEEDFNTVCAIIVEQNMVNKSSAEERMNNPSDAKAAQIIKKIKEGRKIREKRSSDSNLNFIDLVASLAAKGNGLNAINVWDLTYYAFNDQFKRMQMIEQYDNARQSILAGADPKKVKIEYWLRPIEKEKS
ncbi:MAG: hypothetical protein IJE43_14570 [Alphaproteobacteria bacterium]|nr:hypothetical protein [Alphaproteobacteria bacterium]